MSFVHAVSPRLTQREGLSAPFIMVVDTAVDLPESPYEGQPVLIRDTGTLQVWDENAWVKVTPGNKPGG